MTWEVERRKRGHGEWGGEREDMGIGEEEERTWGVGRRKRRRGE